MGAASPSSDDSGVVAIGSVIDNRYRIDAVLGTGGMGRVYRGEHISLGRAVAIKVLHTDIGRNKEAAQRFQREALASGRLDHPNIVGVSDFGTLDDGSLYLVMEALDGESVGARLARDKRVPWRDAVEITRGVLAGLRHAHDRGVVHRDIKPDNVFLAKKDGEQVIKILDFGIAKLYAGSVDDPAQTRAGLTVGTPAYLSPEQAVGGAITPASDLYSTSIVLYEMLVGRAPYDDKDPLAMLTAHVSKEPPKLHDIAPDLELPPGLEDVVRRGLAKIAAERIASASAYLELLDGVILAVGQHALAVATEQSQSLAIPAGPHAPIATPIPGRLATPIPGRLATPLPSPDTSFVRSFDTPTPAPLGTAPTATALATPPPLTNTPPPSRPISLAEHNEPIPRRWILIAGVVVAIAVVFAIVLVVATRGGSSKPAGSHRVEDTSTPRDVPIAASAAPTPQSLPTLIDKTAPLDHDTELKAALHDLELGKTCAERKAAIPKLVELHDPRALAPLRQARYRMRGGVLGLGDSNTNACLTADATAAIKELTKK
jgi:serine/threonine protein kinase